MTLFSAKAEYLDKQISKGVLGQTMSTDDGASLSQAIVHENVRHDIARADARQLSVTINRDLVRPYVDFNYGPRDRYPTVVIPITESEDIKALAEVVAKLVPLGLKVSMPGVRKRIGFEDPDEDDEVLHPPAAVAKEPPADDDPPPDDPPPNDPPPRRRPARRLKDEDDPARARLLPVCPSCGGRHALAAEQVDELDGLVADALENWEQDLDPLFEPLKKLFERARSYEELKTGLEDLAAKMDAGPLADRLAKLMMKGRGLGDTGEADRGG